MSDQSGQFPPPEQGGGQPSYGQGQQGGQPGYGQYPSMPSAGYSAPAQAGPRPSTVENAVRLMFAQVALSVINVIVLIATVGSLKDHIKSQNSGYDASKIDSVANAAVAVGIVVAIIFIVLYALLALQVRKGKNWARIVTWVLAALGVLSGLSGLAGTGTGLNKSIGVIGLLIDIAIIVLLALAPSNQYFSKKV